MPWFKVKAERFDWIPQKGTMICYKRGTIGYQTRDCVNYGVGINAIEEIEKPKGVKVDKSGKVTLNAN